jgi:hypothetical protein
MVSEGRRGRERLQAGVGGVQAPRMCWPEMPGPAATRAQDALPRRIQAVFLDLSFLPIGGQQLSDSRI